MASALVKGISRVCQRSMRRVVLQSPVIQCVASFQRGFRSALPPADEIPEKELAEYEVSKKEFKFVERLLPQATVPPIPLHESYPTPSGWVPPKASALSLSYFVRRTKNHMLPIYEEFRNGNRPLVMVKGVDGDIWAFDKDLREYLQQVAGRQIVASQVNELGGFVRVKGRVAENISQFLLEKGF